MKALYKDDGNGMASLSGLMIDANGQVQEIPAGTKVDGAATVPVAQAQAAGLLLSSNRNTPPKMNYQNAFVPVETANGALMQQREEAAGFGGQLEQAYNLVITNTQAAPAASQKVVLGDGSKNIRLKLGLPALVDITFGGSNGADSLTYLQNFLESGGQIRLHELQITATALDGTGKPGVFSDSSLVSLNSLSIGGNANIYTQNINFDITQDGSQFNLYIRRLASARAILGRLNAFIINIPAATVLSINFRFVSRSSGESMKLENTGF